MRPLSKNCTVDDVFQLCVAVYGDVAHAGLSALLTSHCLGCSSCCHLVLGMPAPFVSVSIPWLPSAASPGQFFHPALTAASIVSRDKNRHVSRTHGFSVVCIAIVCAAFHRAPCLVWLAGARWM